MFAAFSTTSWVQKGGSAARPIFFCLTFSIVKFIAILPNNRLEKVLNASDETTVPFPKFPTNERKAEKFPTSGSVTKERT